MYRLILFILFLSVVSSCSRQQQRQSDTASGKETVQENQQSKNVSSTGNFGEMITPDHAMPVENLPSAFTQPDSLQIKLSGKIRESCTDTGCWMDLDMGNGEVVYVTFLNDAFVIPTDAAGKNAIAEGWAYRKKLSIEELKDKAKDDGKTPEEVTKITQPGYEYSFVAKGVIIK